MRSYDNIYNRWSQNEKEQVAGKCSTTELYPREEASWEFWQTEAEKEDFGLLPIMYKLVSCCLLFIGCLNPLWSLPVLDSREEPLQLSGKMISFPYVSLERVFKGLKCNVRDKNEYSFLKESCEINSPSYEKNSEGPYNTSQSQ